MVVLPDRGIAIGKYEVTFDEWDTCVADGGCNGYQPPDGKRGNPPWGRGKRPVIYVSWGDVQSYVQWLTKKTGITYRLPLEEEWEYACYGGNKTDYCGGSKIDTVAWYEENSGGQTHPVGQKQANGYGLHDMTGNVWEWTDSCKGTDCGIRVMRGGSWFYDAWQSRVAIRLGFLASLRSYSYGFRVVRARP
jgi:formylglycine-generating enzyme required for sulfatase activity